MSTSPCAISPHASAGPPAANLCAGGGNSVSRESVGRESVGRDSISRDSVFASSARIGVYGKPCTPFSGVQTHTEGNKRATCMSPWSPTTTWRHSDEMHTNIHRIPIVTTIYIIMYYTQSHGGEPSLSAAGQCRTGTRTLACRCLAARLRALKMRLCERMHARMHARTHAERASNRRTPKCPTHHYCVGCQWTI